MLAGIPNSLPTFDPDAVDEDEEDADLKELNSQLDILTTVFPHVQPEVFREMLVSFSEDSRLHVITEALLKKQDRWVRGRRRAPPVVVGPNNAESEACARLPTTEKFRSEIYKTAAKEALYAEFKGLSHSTIKAVLAESNYSYSRARPALLAVSSKSWRFSVTNFFTRRKVPSEDDHPLIEWQKQDPNGGRPLAPRLIATNCSELNKELYHTLVVPIMAKQTKEQLQKDRVIANAINDEQAESAGEMYDCECCFTPSSFEQMTVCGSSSHWICFRCVRFAVNEALYGQGWARSINMERHTLNCLAPGFISQESVQRALLEEPDGQTTLSKLQQRAANDVLLKSQLPLTHCPFCHYAEVDDISLTLRHPAPRWLSKNLVRVTGGLLNPLHESKSRVLRRRMGRRFRCQNPDCGRDSCVSCAAEWRDPHTCHAKALVSLRQYVENAISNAIKRTCPRCHVSFVKDSGCNKLVCPCGFTICYVCRASIKADEGYNHFCTHFRERVGQRCLECDKCDLYQVDDVDAIAQRVAVRAEGEWRQMNQLCGKEGVGRGKSEEFVRVVGKRPWEVMLDKAVNAVYV
ncbi:uncharacterized protein IWZ02DRAFT_472543 [Phyllosticta citriasiana]|uniref:uncharacterized protein n=1 Tax=Phyllosticta citriasiana TaxID=595635 RepID=UPI0030FD53EA